MSEDPTIKIPQHRHCRYCGKAFVGDGDYCSQECKEQDGAVAKKKIKRYMILIGVIWIATILAIFYVGV